MDARGAGNGPAARLAAEGLTVITVTHDIHIAAAMPRRLDIDDGVVTERDPVIR
jgi:ABC-type lipoprotein export system ATPase subunit